MCKSMTVNRSKNETKRNQILAAATQLFTEQGYAATSMVLIAKQADVSKQTVYSHFGSKDDLFAASIEQKCDSTLMINAENIDITNPKETLFGIAQRFVEMITSKEALAVHKICSFESKSYPHLSELFYQAGPERLTAEIALLMERLVEAKILVIANTHDAALQYLHVMKGEAWMRAEFNIKEQIPQSEIDRYLRASVEHFMKGYAP